MVAVPTPAHAARGVLTVNTTMYPDPLRQCIYNFNADTHHWYISNDTDQPVYLHSNLEDLRCFSGRVMTIPPGESRSGTENRNLLSVWVPA
jgi:hypothetical protein